MLITRAQKTVSRTWDQSTLAKLVNNTQGPWSGMPNGSRKISITNHLQNTSSKTSTFADNFKKLNRSSDQLINPQPILIKVSS